MALEHLLKHHWFFRDPFETWMAEDERASLGSWFVEPPFLRTLLGDTTPVHKQYVARSDLVFGRRGTGKTALRIRLEDELTSNAPQVMVARYVDFGPALQEGSSPSMRSHVEEILRLATGELIGYLAEDIERYKKLTLGQKSELFGLIRHYFDALPTEIRTRYQAELSPIAGRVGIVATKLGKSAIDLYNGVLNVIRGEKIEPASWAPDMSTSPIYPITRLERFNGLSRAAGIDSIWVMVDGIDEAPGVRSPGEIFDCVSGILLSQRLIEFREGNRQTICFKIFLTHPQELKPILKGKDFRFDRISCHEITLNRVDLDRALVGRLAHFSTGRVKSFDTLCQQDARTTHDRLLDESDERPRTLFRMCHEILSAFNRNDQTNSPLLDRKSIDEGIAKAQAAATG